MQDHAADQLHVEVAHAHPAPADLARQREGLGQRLVELDLARLHALRSSANCSLQLVVLEQFEFGLPVR